MNSRSCSQMMMTCKSATIVSFLGIHLSVSGGSILGGVNTNDSFRGNLSFTYNTWTNVALQYNDQTKQQVSSLSI